jgi:hypothetical protein
MAYFVSCLVEELQHLRETLAFYELNFGGGGVAPVLETDEATPAAVQYAAAPPQP